MSTSIQDPLLSRPSILPQGGVCSNLRSDGLRPARMNKAFHIRMACACVLLLLISIAGCRFTNLTVPGAAEGTLGFFLIFAATLPVLAYWREKKHIYQLDAAFTVYWAVLLKVLLAYPIVIAARLGMGISLRDGYLAGLDQSLGVDVAQIFAWAPQHWIGQYANASYGLLTYLILLAILLPILTGRVHDAQRFITANVIAFAVSLPIYALVPAIGPWFGGHFVPTGGQVECQNALLLLRQPGPRTLGSAGIICFPSFHAIWAVLCAYALWGNRWFRIPAFVLSCLILFSTVSTGWHYFSDVAAGTVIAALSILISNWLCRRWSNNLGTSDLVTHGRPNNLEMSEDVCMQEMTQ